MGKRENTAIVVDGIREGKSDDDILQALFEQGVVFGDLRTVFNDIIKDKGLRLTAKERKAKTAEILEGISAISETSDVTKLVAKLSKNLKVNDAKALGSLRSWAKENGITLPKAARISTPRKPGFGGHYAKILAFLLENREADKKAVVAFCHANSIPEAYSTTALNVVHFAKIWNGEIDPESEVEVEAETETAK